MNRLKLVAETLRAALNAIAVEAPIWLRQVAPVEWYERYSRRIEDYRLPKSRESALPEVTTVRQMGARHYSRDEGKTDGNSPGRVRFKSNRELARASEAIESPL